LTNIDSHASTQALMMIRNQNGTTESADSTDSGPLWGHSSVNRAADLSAPQGFCRAMLCKRGLCHHAVCVCVCVSRSYILSKRIKISSKFFHHRVD